MGGSPVGVKEDDIDEDDMKLGSPVGSPKAVVAAFESPKAVAGFS